MSLSSGDWLVGSVEVAVTEHGIEDVSAPAVQGGERGQTPVLDLQPNPGPRREPSTQDLFDFAAVQRPSSNGPSDF